jgi:hypothetical protein
MQLNDHVVAISLVVVAIVALLLFGGRGHAGGTVGSGQSSQ